ncbi:maleylpyruvate isomerase N-terminal domain-containing protein [Actinospica durhamensis]|uniref:Maleylpyruvate isomerase N-terminal domain-containing protein n=1 Tax=Actinospica durhamensis TaxID=1508375 RepID=A0A941IR80_9ACTN|nr:maleylpyruvate isomerase N-terminal domain-containing protein [Actinospica durhamensis]MBR7838515.1 maleylpyruvate isomerase N-terminal domain-containing protein [Actinospica durhamensis]
MVTIFEDFLAAADAAVELIGARAVAERWGEPSALAGFTIGGLAAHLGWQVQSGRLALAAPRPEPGAVVTPLLEHYARAAWVGAGLDAPVNLGIRDAGEERAKAGAGEQARLTALAREEAAKLLASGEVEPETVIAMPWVEGRAMTAADVLTTRLMELLVHGDDLAVSLGVATPEYAESAYATVNDLLLRVSARRHGSLAVLRTLSRAERAPETIAAF